MAKNSCQKKFFLERFEGFLKLKIDFENQIFALFNVYFWPFNKSHEKINTIFVISAIIASIWNVFSNSIDMMKNLLR